ncbi:helicase-exonuclease AddAB subunit AddA [Jeotgalibacillus haloalkalitolerans]|uniref:ATP-dependent helicase/nuclease subunit A n=1 Tax=Jeotgalibacillus haloalkalitolerans TaxID=3104292 RepID=A0ABU5KQK2_9BACL|nr:helicase-exonuclease AddAB subunit AddA [Jeotgalibacillus sp. HH7-29]MDZ5713041.1 helicase-exonuclease AddAB subunit AddA [Jeotgalibacillus sp. HH7-29]
MIPVKPEHVTWTDAQWRAIFEKGSDILVAAAAGSGKTAVLVERLIQKVLDTDQPTDIDELLVVTFTNASAAEMKHRVGEALEKALAADPESRHLRKQLTLINKASISTLHSFCLEVIRKYYYLIDIDPGFRIADDTEAELLKDEVVEEILEHEYGIPDNHAFIELVEAVTNDRSDDALHQMIRKLHTFSRSHADPDTWLDGIVSLHETEHVQIDDHPLANYVLFHVQLEAEGAIELINLALDTARKPGGPYPRAVNFEDDLRQLNEVRHAAGWKEAEAAVSSFSMGRLKPCKGDDFDEELVEQAKKWRDQAKKMINDLKDGFFVRSPEQLLEDMNQMTGRLSTLVELVRTFEKAFKAAKEERGLVDFNDLEHFCLEILRDPDTGEPSQAAYHYRNQFKEVLVDEYQDTNMVQETILQLVKSGGEKDGNLFMVGDVKQSIYRFRLAEPNLFLGKYRTFQQAGSGQKIDLAKNFRSRPEVLDGVNFIFRQIMGEMVGEIDYDKDAELIPGAPYPTDLTVPVRFAVIDQADEDAPQEEMPEEVMDERELERSTLEARYMIKEIRSMIDGGRQIYDVKKKLYRPLEYRDIVILTRSMTWTPDMMDEFRQAGIPLYADLSTGYFDATEVAIMVSLLKVIDNPIQDIPLASVLRSPIVRCTEEELAKIRKADPKGSFWNALQAYMSSGDEDTELKEKCSWFLISLRNWRALARTGAVSELVWQLFRDTQFYDFVGGLPGGKQRQANLRALYDRSRQYESTSFRGLFRFLRFVERMRERGDDLGAARALSEQEDVVRLMTIHKSKGLEFPVVFISGMARQFNEMDLRGSYLLDKDFGLALSYVDIENRISSTTLPQMAFKEKKRLENLAEEMRVLYVAMTRAKEELILIATVPDAEKLKEKWSLAGSYKSWLLPDFTRKGARSYADWIGPALARHPHAIHSVQSGLIEDPSVWEMHQHHKQLFTEEQKKEESAAEWLTHVRNHEPVPGQSEHHEDIQHRLKWHYPYEEAAMVKSKQSVSSIKRQHETLDETGADSIVKPSKKLYGRPAFLQQEKMTAAEKGTVMHTVMQQVPLQHTPEREEIESLVASLVVREILTEEQAETVRLNHVASFFQSPLGRRMINANQVRREVPFTYAAAPAEAGIQLNVDDPVLIQGIADCLFEDDQGLVLLDYKTDYVDRADPDVNAKLAERYRLQLSLYRQALEKSLNRKIDEVYLYFFNADLTIKVEEN